MTGRQVPVTLSQLGSAMGVVQLGLMFWKTGSSAASAHVPM